jgi:hypothetical protein
MVSHRGLLGRRDNSQAMYDALLPAGLQLLAAGGPQTNPAAAGQQLAQAGLTYAREYQTGLDRQSARTDELAENQRMADRDIFFGTMLTQISDEDTQRGLGADHWRPFFAADPEAATEGLRAQVTAVPEDPSAPDFRMFGDTPMERNADGVWAPARFEGWEPEGDEEEPLTPTQVGSNNEIRAARAAIERMIKRGLPDFDDEETAISALDAQLGDQRDAFGRPVGFLALLEKGMSSMVGEDPGYKDFYRRMTTTFGNLRLQEGQGRAGRAAGSARQVAQGAYDPNTLPAPVPTAKAPVLPPAVPSLDSAAAATDVPTRPPTDAAAQWIAGRTARARGADVREAGLSRTAGERAARDAEQVRLQGEVSARRQLMRTRTQPATTPAAAPQTPRVGSTISVQGENVRVIEVRPDGTIRVQFPNGEKKTLRWNPLPEINRLISPNVSGAESSQPRGGSGRDTLAAGRRFRAAPPAR